MPAEWRLPHRAGGSRWARRRGPAVRAGTDGAGGCARTAAVEDGYLVEQPVRMRPGTRPRRSSWWWWWFDANRADRQRQGAAAARRGAAGAVRARRADDGVRRAARRGDVRAGRSAPAVRAVGRWTSVPKTLTRCCSRPRMDDRCAATTGPTRSRGPGQGTRRRTPHLARPTPHRPCPRRLRARRYRPPQHGPRRPQRPRAALIYRHPAPRRISTSPPSRKPSWRPQHKTSAANPHE